MRHRRQAFATGRSTVCWCHAGPGPRSVHERQALRVDPAPATLAGKAGLSCSATGEDADRKATTAASAVGFGPSRLQGDRLWRTWRQLPSHTHSVAVTRQRTSAATALASARVTLAAVIYAVHGSFLCLMIPRRFNCRAPSRPGRAGARDDQGIGLDGGVCLGVGSNSRASRDHKPNLQHQGRGLQRPWLRQPA